MIRKIKQASKSTKEWHLEFVSPSKRRFDARSYTNCASVELARDRIQRVEDGIFLKSKDISSNLCHNL